MSSWETVPISSVATIDRDGVAPSEIESGTVYVGLEHIEAGGRLINVARVKGGDLASTKFRFSRKHVLYGKLRPYLAKIAAPDFDGVCSTDILPIRPGANLDRSYLTHFLRQPSMVAIATSRSEGVNLPRLSPTTLAGFVIPLPPLGEQRRIAAILDAADALRQKRRLATSALDQLKQSIFIEIFGNPATNPKEWPIATIGELLDSASYGTSAKAGTEGTMPVLRMNNLTYDGKVDLNDLKYLDLDEDEADRYTVRSGDILFNRTNSPDLVGKTAVYRGEEPIAYAGYLVRLRTNPLALPDYISCFLNSRYGKAVLRGMCKSIIGMANINATEVQAIRIPRPPIELQAEFSERVAAVDKTRRAFERSEAMLASLFGSLQYRAFCGEL